MGFNVRIGTAGALRAVDKWKEDVVSRYRRYVARLYFLLIAVGFRRQLVLPIIITIGLSLHFFIFELVSMIIFGVLFLRLQSYRFANMLLRVLNRRP